MSRRLSLPVSEWPLVDQERWTLARKRVSFLHGPAPASRWGARRERIGEQALGQLVAWRIDDPAFDSRRSALDGLTPELFARFVEQLQARVAPVSVAMMVGAIQGMARALAPDRDWTWLGAAYSDLKRNARSSRDRRAHYVPPESLYDLGILLMREGKDRPSERFFRPDTTYRDGLMIAMLCCCVPRIGNFWPIEIGRHLLFDQDRYWLDIPDEETKTGRPQQSDLPPELTPFIDHYLKEVRPRLLARGDILKTRRLWINRDGREMLEGAVRTQIEKRTQAAFGRHVWPHLFRHCAATGLVDRAPENINLAPDILGHADIRTTQRYYVLATGNTAHRQVQRSFEDERRGARKRQKEMRGRTSKP